MRDVVIVGHPGVLGLELFGVVDVFDWVNFWLVEHGRPPEFQAQVATLDGGPLPVSGGLEITSSALLADCPRPIDTLIVPGGQYAVAASEHTEFVCAIRDAATNARRLASLCTGAFILAAAGLLDHKQATTHWSYGPLLASRYPAVLLNTDPIFTRDGDTWTSAGVAASLDLLLALVEEDLGSEAARVVARSLVLFLRRTGNQAQFSTQLSTQLADRHPIRELQQFIADHPEADLSLGALARQVHMSPRHFARVFGAEVGLSPARYVEQVRLETARRRLEESKLPVELIAADCGFGSGETLRRVFVQTLGVSPTEYRRRFGMFRSQQDLDLDEPDGEPSGSIVGESSVLNGHRTGMRVIGDRFRDPLATEESTSGRLHSA